MFMLALKEPHYYTVRADELAGNPLQIVCEFLSRVRMTLVRVTNVKTVRGFVNGFPVQI